MNCSTGEIFRPTENHPNTFQPQSGEIDWQKFYSDEMDHQIEDILNEFESKSPNTHVEMEEYDLWLRHLHYPLPFLPNPHIPKNQHFFFQ